MDLIKIVFPYVLPQFISDYEDLLGTSDPIFVNAFIDESDDFY